MTDDEFEAIRRDADEMIAAIERFAFKWGAKAVEFADRLTPEQRDYYVGRIEAAEKLTGR